MWHLGLEVNVTGDNGSGQRTGRTLIITMISGSSFLSPISYEVYWNATTEHSLINIHMPILLYEVISSDAEQINEKKVALHTQIEHGKMSEKVMTGFTPFEDTLWCFLRECFDKRFIFVILTACAQGPRTGTRTDVT